MGTAGTQVVKADGTRGILSSGDEAIFDPDGTCVTCCPSSDCSSCFNTYYLTLTGDGTHTHFAGMGLPCAWSNSDVVAGTDLFIWQVGANWVMTTYTWNGTYVTNTWTAPLTGNPCPPLTGGGWTQTVGTQTINTISGTTP